MAQRNDPFREMERLLGTAFRSPSAAGMPLDLYRTGETFVVKVDLPGVDPASIDIDIEERTLTIRADRPADDPYFDLVPELTGEILKVIRQLADARMTMVIVTHEMAFARDVADRVIFMDGGVIVEQGAPRDVIEHPQEERTRQFLSRFSNR